MTEHTPGAARGTRKIAVGLGVGPGRIKALKEPGCWWAAQIPRIMTTP